MKFSVCDESSKPQPPAWWSKLFRGEHGGIGLRPSSAVLKKFESTASEETAGSTAPPSRSSSWSMADSSSDAGNERQQQQPNLKRIRQHVDLLQAAVKVSKGDDANLSDLPAFPNLPPSEGGAKPFARAKAQSPQTTKAKKAEGKDDQQQRQRRLSRSPVLPVSRPWDPSYSPDAVAAATSSSRDSSPNRPSNNNGSSSSAPAPARRPYRHRYELGPLCCPACDEAARAEAEEAYARATWRMYDRITRARAAAAARRARLIEEEEDARAQQQTQHRQEMVCLPIAPAAGEALPQSTRRMPLPSRFEKSPFPSLPSLYHDNDDEQNTYTNNEDFERDDDAHGAVFMLDLDQ
uniref:Uncharacterized protein n=1 Tax=Pseudictyota dubia TaxID=2749911 RepID=A0A7R9ZE13_9STRA|mmetsp:Transcript_43449/g.80866  ORF Transcript_43449/g.80866 Transcript_43449/m.80866 type:complete len:350 (+) Transcript_43449:196-1245(+)